MLDKFNIPPEYKKDWKTSPGFTNIRPITLDDCKNGTGQVEKIKPEALAPENKAGVMKFGKNKGREFSWIKQNDPGYWGWMLENIEGIEKQIPKNLL